LIGLGALGSNLLLSGRELDVAWDIVDFDYVEVKNTMSQFHTHMTLRRNKAQSLHQTLGNLFKKRNVTSVPVRLDVDNVSQILRNARIVVDCVDDPPTRVLLAKYCKENGIPCLHGGLAENGEFAIVRWDDTFVADEKSAADVATCEAGENLPFIMLASAQLALALQLFLEDGSRSSFNISVLGVQQI